VWVSMVAALPSRSTAHAIENWHDLEHLPVATWALHD